MAAKRTSVDHAEILRLVMVIDDEGTRLSRTEIDFIANVIDTNQRTFTSAEAKRVGRIYYKRVVNGKPDYDDC